MFHRFLLFALALSFSALGAQEPLLVHVGGTMRPAMEEICALYEKESGQKVELNYNDSGALMTAIKTTKKGDVCVLHDPFPFVMQKEGIASQCFTVAGLIPVIVVPKGNPKKIQGLQDLIRADVKVGLGDATYSTAGHIMPILFRKAKLTESMATKEIVRARGGGELANAVKLGSLDAAIVWNAVAFARKDALDAIAIAPEFLPDAEVDAVVSPTYGKCDMSLTRVVVMTLATSTQADAARKLADLAASPRGRAIFARRGFTSVHGKLAGSLMVSCAAGVREPVAAIAASFEKETGVKVELNYANSGQLLGQIAASKIGDVFVPGDLGFIAQAKTRGLTQDDGYAFCRFVPTIYVRKGNPKGITTLADLTKPGVKLALADASSAVGALQAKVFEKNKIDLAALKANTVTSPATVNEVALAVKLGSVDAGIIWNALANFAPAEAEVVAIPDDQNVTATVAACVLSGSKNPEAALAFIFRLISPEGQKILASKGFTKP